MATLRLFYRYSSEDVALIVEAVSGTDGKVAAVVAGATNAQLSRSNRESPMPVGYAGLLLRARRT